MFRSHGVRVFTTRSAEGKVTIPIPILSTNHSGKKVSQEFREGEPTHVTQGGSSA